MAWNRLAVFVVFACAPILAAQPSRPPALRMPDGVDFVKIPLVHGDDCVFVRVSINDQDAGWFMVDTGSNQFLLDNKAAEKLKLTKISTVSGGDVLGGNQKLAGVLHKIDSANFGGMTSGPRFLASTDIAAIPFLGEKISGIIGTDFLGEMPVTIDFREPSLTFYRTGKIPKTITDTARKENLRLFSNIPAVRGEMESIGGWYLIDSGFNRSFELFTPFIRAHSEILQGKHCLSEVGFGLGGLMEDKTTQFGLFSIIGKTIKDARGGYIQGPSGRGDFEDFACAGTVGAGAIEDRRLTFDFLNKQLWIETPEIEKTDEYLKRIEASQKTDLIAVAPLLRALNDRRLDAVKILLEQGADIKMKGLAGVTALMSASYSPEAIKLLLDRGADPNVTSILKADTPLIWAAEHGEGASIALLLKAGAKIDYANTLGRTAFFRATEGNYLDAMKTLIDAKANINTPTKEGVGPLQMAVMNESAEAVDLILQHKANPNAHDAEGVSPLMVAAKYGNVELLGKLIKAGATVDQTDTKGRSALFWAANGQHSAAVRILLYAGANPKLKANDGNTAWDIALNRGAIPVLQVLRFETPATRPAK